MTIRGIAARPARTNQGLWISVSCSVSFTAIAIPAAREPGPLVTRCRSRTVAKVARSGWWCAGGSAALQTGCEPRCDRARRPRRSGSCRFWASSARVLRLVQDARYLALAECYDGEGGRLLANGELGQW